MTNLSRISKNVTLCTYQTKLLEQRSRTFFDILHFLTFLTLDSQF